MFIRELELRNFRGYGYRRFVFSQPRSLIVGENGVGKSTIAEAIALLLTGHCTGVDGKGQGQRELIKAGAEEAIITADIDGLGTVTRTIRQNGPAETTTPIGVIQDQLRASDPFITAAVYGSTFFELHHGDAKNLLMSLLNVRVPVTNDRGEQEVVGLAEVERRYQVAFNDRKALKKAVAATFVPTIERRPDLEREDEDDLQAIVDGRNGSYQQAVQKTADVRARVKQLQERRAALERGERDLAQLRADRKAQLDLVAEYAIQHEEAGAALQKLEAERPANDAGAADEISRLQVFVGKVQDQAGGVEGARTCVLGPVPCLTPAKEFKAELTKAKKQIAALKKRVDAGEQFAQHLGAAQQMVRSAADARQKAQDKADAIGAAIDAEEKRRDELDPILDALKQDAEDAEAAESVVGGAAADLAKAQAKLQALRDYQRAIAQRDQAVAHVDDLKVKLKEAERQVDELGPNGARATALQDSLADFQQAINAALAVFRFELQINVEPWVVLVKTPNSGGSLPFALLSKGQRLWTGLAFQLALAAVSGLDFCIVDDVEGVVGEARANLTDLVMTAPVGQVLVIKAQASGDERPHLDGLQVIEAGDERPVLV